MFVPIDDKGMVGRFALSRRSGRTVRAARLSFRVPDDTRNVATDDARTIMKQADLRDSRPNPSLTDAHAVAQALGCDPERGLDSAEAARRLAADGPNELRAKPPVPAWRRLLAQFRDPLIYLLLAAIVISLVAWFIQGARGVPIDALVIALIVVANAVLGYVQEAKAESAVAALARMTTITSSVIRDGRLMRIPSAELVRGDLLVLGEGDSVGADGRLMQAAVGCACRKPRSQARARRCSRTSPPCPRRPRSAIA